MKDRFLDQELRHRAPDCVTCHMPEGDHRVRSARGVWFLVRESGNKEWNNARQIIRQALGFSDKDGTYSSPGQTLVAFKALDLPVKEFKRRENLLHKTCRGCHSAAFIKKTIAEQKRILIATDRRLADYLRWLVKKKGNAGYVHLLEETGDADTRRAQELFFRFRQPIYRAALHANPDLAARLLTEMTRKIAAYQERQDF